MSLHYRQVADHIILIGNTFPYREILKNIGGRFDGANKSWLVPYSEQALQQIETLCRNAGGGALPSMSAAVQAVRTAPAAGNPQSTSLSSPLTAALQASLAAPAAIAATPAPLSAASDMSIAQLLDRIGTIFKREFTLPVWVTGEIQNLNYRATGVFFQLAEIKKEGSQDSATVAVNATIWKSQLAMLGSKHKDLKGLLQEGIKIRCQVMVTFYRDRGSVSLNMIDVDPSFTLGELALARLQLLKELRQKDLAEANRRQRLTVFPFAIGLITADQSRAFSDFTHQLISSGFPGTIYLAQSPMQGDATPQAVVAAIEKLTRQQCDLIVITRGGGSTADLRWFDNASIAYAIAQSKIPVVCAIGHHDDVCVAEEICYRREKTPTAAADFIINCWQEIRQRIDLNGQRLIANLEQAFQRQQVRLAGNEQRFIKAAERFILLAEHRLHQLGQNMGQSSHSHLITLQQRWLATHHRLALQSSRILVIENEQCRLLATRVTTAALQNLQIKKENLLESAAQLRSLDASPWLEKGWTQLTLNYRPVNSVKQLVEGAQVTAVLKDGSITAEVKQIKTKTIPQKRLKDAYDS